MTFYEGIKYDITGQRQCDGALFQGNPVGIEQNVDEI